MRQGLDDITVLELGSTITAPYATQALGAMGAEVIKIEPPSGDPFRAAGALTDDGISGYFSMCNSGKRSITLNLKEDSGTEIFYQLASDADIIVENNRPGVVDRLGVGFEDVSEITEDIIYCSLSGYGQDGPWSDQPGFDPIIQGQSGLMSVTGEKGGEPVRIGVAVVDLMSAVWTVTAIMNALRHRDRTGEGTYLDMSMFDVAISMLTKRAAQYYTTGETPVPMGTEDTWVAPYGAYPTKDDELIMIGAAWQRLWESLCELIDREDLIDDERFLTERSRVNNREDLNEILEKEFKRKTQEEWLELLEDEIPAGPVSNVGEALTNEHSRSRNIDTELTIPGKGPVTVLNLPMKMNGEKQQFDSPPPEQGEHSQEILEELGFSDSEIERFESENAI